MYCAMGLVRSINGVSGDAILRMHGITDYNSRTLTSMSTCIRLLSKQVILRLLPYHQNQAIPESISDASSVLLANFP